MGAAIPGTTILLRGERIERSIVIDESGNYAIQLHPGEYRIKIENPAYRRFRRRIRVRPSETVALRIVLLAKGRHVSSID